MFVVVVVAAAFDKFFISAYLFDFDLVVKVGKNLK
jgi:hypothetical protein